MVARGVSHRRKRSPSPTPKSGFVKVQKFVRYHSPRAIAKRSALGIDNGDLARSDRQSLGGSDDDDDNDDDWEIIMIPVDDESDNTLAGGDGGTLSGARAKGKTSRKGRTCAGSEKSRFLGVSAGGNGRWRVRCRLPGRPERTIGNFDDERIAARAYDDYVSAVALPRSCELLVRVRRTSRVIRALCR